MNVLLIEDEVNLSEALCHLLKKENYSVDAAFDGQDGLEKGLSGRYDIILLDIMLPKKNGYDVLKELREAKVSTPVILLTAKNQISDKIKGLDLGADDYVSKPFSASELMARMRALLRRKTDKLATNELEYGGLTLNLSSYELSSKDKKIKITLKEGQILELLMANPNHVITKDDLIIKIWGYESDAEYNNIEVYISFLRKKIEYLKTSVVIETVRGLGYKLV
ncbi:MAG: response regulator transcription factor [Clostridia bacterium]|nr:response regulator transcription factor [Clostridia bacterium]